MKNYRIYLLALSLTFLFCNTQAQEKKKISLQLSEISIGIPLHSPSTLNLANPFSINASFSLKPNSRWSLETGVIGLRKGFTDWSYNVPGASTGVDTTYLFTHEKNQTFGLDLSIRRAMGKGKLNWYLGAGVKNYIQKTTYESGTIHMFQEGIMIIQEQQIERSRSRFIHTVGLSTEIGVKAKLTDRFYLEPSASFFYTPGGFNNFFGNPSLQRINPYFQQYDAGFSLRVGYTL